jgi:hypothetical protein
MIRLDEVGELMHYNIILHPLRKACQTVAYENGPGGTVARAAPVLLSGGILNAVPRQLSLEISLI